MWIHMSIYCISIYLQAAEIKIPGNQQVLVLQINTPKPLSAGRHLCLLKTAGKIKINSFIM